MKNQLYRGLSQTELKARCDESCKRLLSNKEIIARVLKFTVDEFSELDINYIRDFCIERKQIYHMPKELTGEQDGFSAEMITGRDSEGKSADFKRRVWNSHGEHRAGGGRYVQY